MGNIGIIKNGGSEALAEKLKEKLSAEIIDGATDLKAKRFDSVLVMNAKASFGKVQEAIDDYLKEGGKLLCLGAPCFSKEYFEKDGGFIDFDGAKAEFFETASPALDFSEKGILKKFQKDTFNPDSKKVEGGAFLDVVDEGVNGGKCLKYQVDKFYINESFEAPVSFSERTNAVGFFAKADENTKTITIVLIEEGGNTFKARITPGESYQSFVLTRRDFVFAGSRSGEKFERDARPQYVDFPKVKFIQFGHALSHAYSVSGKHSFLIDKVSFGYSPHFDNKKIFIDGVCPEYKFYPITDCKEIRLNENQRIISKLDANLKEPSAFPPRLQGTGYNKGRRSRFIPLVEALDKKGEVSGYLAYLMINYSYGELQAGRKNTMLGVFTPTEESFYEANLNAVCEVMDYLSGSAFLLEGGAEEYIYSDEKSAKFGLTVLAKEGADLSSFEAEIKINGEAHLLPLERLEAFKKENGYVFLKGEFEKTPCECSVSVSLKENGKVIDSVFHEVQIYELKPENERQFAHIKKGENEIYIGEKPVRFFGVNYMPSFITGYEHWEDFEHYVAGFSYDPEVVEKDLRRIKEIGMNAVSVFAYHTPCIGSNNLLHLICLCKRLGLYVNLSLRPHANPFDFNQDEVREMIEKWRLDEQDAVVGYDIAWERYVGTYEPCYGNFNGRKSFDEGFGKYIINRYGSYENLENLTGCKLPRNEKGEVIGLSDDMLREDGEHNALTAVYRSYIDNEVALAHIKAREFILSCDKNHIVSARSGDASTIPLVDPGIYGYDYKAMSMGCDYVSPESYALSDDNRSMRQGVFTNIYARYANPDNVIQWMEFGKSIWIGSNFTDNSLSKKWQADYYRSFFDMLITGHSAGLFAWWWAGGYRVGENSDFGIINPDGTDRPVTKVFREYAEKFLNQPKLREAEVKIKIDRDLHSDGLRSLYRSVEEELFSAVESGKTVMFYDGGNGKTSADVSLDECYNLPAKGFSPRFLDGFLIEKTVDGNRARLRFANSQKSTWICKNGEGAVRLLANGKEYPLSNDVLPNGQAIFEIELEDEETLCVLNAKGRTDFGERVIITKE